LIPHSSKHVGAPAPVAEYLHGKTQSPTTSKHDSNADDDNEDDDEDDEQESKFTPAPSLESLIPQASLPTANFFNLMSNWVNAASSSSMHVPFIPMGVNPLQSTVASSNSLPFPNFNNNSNNDITSASSSGLLINSQVIISI